MNWNEVQVEVRNAALSWLNRSSPRISEARDFIVPEFKNASFSVFIEEVARRDAALAFDVGHLLLRDEPSSQTDREPWLIHFPSERRLSFTSRRIHSLNDATSGRPVPGFPNHRIHFGEKTGDSSVPELSVFLFWASWLSGILAQIAAETSAYAEQRYQGGRLIQDWSEHRLKLDHLCSEILGHLLALDQIRSAPEIMSEPLQALTFRLAHRAEALASDALSLFGGAGYMREYPIAERFACLTCFVPTLRSDPLLSKIPESAYRRMNRRST